MCDKRMTYKLKLGLYYERLKAMSITQEDIADAVYRKRWTINRIVGGHRTCTEEVARKWAAFMGVPLEDLFEEVREPVEVRGE